MPLYLTHLFFFFCKNIALRKLENSSKTDYRASTGQRTKRGIFSTTNWKKNEGGREVGGNAA
jgi:hypothetical protein